MLLHDERAPVGEAARPEVVVHAPVVRPSPARAVTLQAKLEVGSVDDPLEAEADDVADRVVADLRRSVDRSATPSWLASSRSDAGRVRRRAQSALADPLAGGSLDQATSSRIQSARSGGQPLPDALRSPMEQSFGHSLENVRVHTDTQAADLSQEISAKAFTTGDDIFFGAGQYQPGSGGGQHLIAHEVAHTVQQSGDGIGRVVQRLATNPAVEARERWAANKPKGYKKIGAMDEEYAEPSFGAVTPQQTLAGGGEASRVTLETDLDEVYKLAEQSNLEFKRKVIALALATGGKPQFRSAPAPAAVDDPVDWDAVVGRGRSDRVLNHPADLGPSVGPQQKRQNAAPSEAMKEKQATAAASAAATKAAAREAREKQTQKDNLDGNIPVGLKGRDRAMEKAVSDYGGKATGLVDILGGTIEYETFEDVVKGFSECSKVGLKSVREKNRIANPTAAGYRDIMLNVALDNGHVAELQFNLTGMLAAKDKGHKQYEEARSLEAYYKEANFALDAENFAKLKRLYNEMRDIYGGAAKEAKMTPDKVTAAFPPPENS